MLLGECLVHILGTYPFLAYCLIDRMVTLRSTWMSHPAAKKAATQNPGSLQSTWERKSNSF